MSKIKSGTAIYMVIYDKQEEICRPLNPFGLYIVILYSYKIPTYLHRPVGMKYHGEISHRCDFDYKKLLIQLWFIFILYQNVL